MYSASALNLTLVNISELEKKPHLYAHLKKQIIDQIADDNNALTIGYSATLHCVK